MRPSRASNNWISSSNPSSTANYFVIGVLNDFPPSLCSKRPKFPECRDWGLHDSAALKFFASNKSFRCMYVSILQEGFSRDLVRRRRSFSSPCHNPSHNPSHLESFMVVRSLLGIIGAGRNVLILSPSTISASSCKWRIIRAERIEVKTRCRLERGATLKRTGLVVTMTTWTIERTGE